MVYKWLEIVQRIVYPPTCLLCNGPGSDRRDLCSACFGELPRLGGACSLCARPLAGPGICGNCQRTPPPFDAAWAPFRYQDGVAELITGLKFQHRLSHARVLGELMAREAVAAGRRRPDVFVPVPLHPARLRSRGFNQALEIARPVARSFAAPLWWHACVRQRNTLAQTSLSAAQRRANLRDAFRAQRSLTDLSCVVIDDVLTSGSTARALALALKRAGAKGVEIWVCARAAPDRLPAVQPIS